MDKMVKPVFPKSIEEHDKEVQEAWSPYKNLPYKNPIALEIELKLRGILNKDLFRYYIQTLITLDPIHVNHVNVDVNFHNADFYAYIIATYDEFDGEFEGGFKVKKIYTNLPEPSVETDCSTIQEVNDILCNWFDIKEACACKYCADGTNKCGESLFNEDILTLGGFSFLNIDVGISEDNELELLTTNSSGDTIFHTTMKIKYCPECGRKIGGE